MPKSTEHYPPVQTEYQQETVEESSQETSRKIKALAPLIRGKANSPKAKNEPSASDASFQDFDPIGNTVRNNPGLTYEEAEEMAKAFGY